MQHTRRCALAILAPAVLVPGAALAGVRSADSPLPRQTTAPRTATILLTRHAEKAAEPASDPPLTLRGRQRAELLATLLHSASITHIYSTTYRRTRQTVAPAAARLNLKVEMYDDTNALAAKLRSLPDGARALVAGHSNTIPALARALAESEDQVLTNLNPKAHLDDNDYDRLIIQTLYSAGADPTTALNTLDLRITIPD